MSSWSTCTPGAEGSTADHVTDQDEDYLGEDRGNAEAFAHMAIDAGASLVIGSGPHVLRGMQFYKHHLIAYSMGNFASYGDFATEGDFDMSMILHVTLSSGRPVQAGPDLPRPVHRGRSARARRGRHRIHRQAVLGGLRCECRAHPAIRGGQSARAAEPAPGRAVVAWQAAR